MQDSHGRSSLIDFGFAIGASTAAVHASHSIGSPDGFTPAQHAVAAHLLFGSQASLSGEPVQLLDEVESLLYTGAFMFGSLLPWRAAAAAKQVSACIFDRSELRRIATDAATAADIAPWVADLSPVLRQVVLWAMQRTSATVDEVLDLHAALQVCLDRRLHNDTRYLLVRCSIECDASEFMSILLTCSSTCHRDRCFAMHNRTRTSRMRRSRHRSWQRPASAVWLLPPDTGRPLTLCVYFTPVVSVLRQQCEPC